jgi:thiol-disulfide isomerase/thioredoxin
MSARVTRKLCCCLVATYSLNATLFAAQTPTIEEVLKTYQVNRDKLSTLHLQMKHTHEWTEAHRKHHRRRAELAAGILKKYEDGAELPPSLADRTSRGEEMRMLRQHVEHERMMSEQRRFEKQYEFFFNGEDYQVRSARNRAESIKENWSFPTAAITPQTLENEYAEFRIYSHSAGSTHFAQIWPGVSSPYMTTYAMISSQPVWKTQSLNFPPLPSPFNPPWGDRHPIDEFFTADAENFRVVGTESQDGRTLTIVDAVVVTHQYPKKDGKGNVVTDDDGNPVITKQAELYRAWIDLARGGIPVRMQNWTTDPEQNIDELAKHSPRRRIVSKQIRQLKNNAWYPAVTVREELDVDPDLPRPRTAEGWKKFGADKRKLKQAVYERITWNCTLVETEFAHNDEFFVLQFPEEIEYYDLDERKFIGALDPKRPIKPGQLAPPLQIATWLDGNERSLKDFRGKVVVLDFWGLWCGICVDSVPRLKLLQEKYQDEPVVFISIHTAVNDREKLAQFIEKFANKHDWQFLAAIDEGTMIANSRTVTAYGVKYYPTQIIIGADGVVRFNDCVPTKDAQYSALFSPLNSSLDFSSIPSVSELDRFEGDAEIRLNEDKEITMEEKKRRATRHYLVHMRRMIDAALKDAELSDK